MANTPHPSPKPEPPKPPPPKYGEHVEAREVLTPQLGADQGSTSDHTVDPPDPGMETVVHEQRRRSAEIEEAGVESWKAAHDQRTPEEKGLPKQVPGVVQPHKDDEHARHR